MNVAYLPIIDHVRFPLVWGGGQHALELINGRGCNEAYIDQTGMRTNRHMASMLRYETSTTYDICWGIEGVYFMWLSLILGGMYNTYVMPLMSLGGGHRKSPYFADKYCVLV